MKQLSLKECLQEMAFSEYTCLEHDEYIAYILVIPTNAADYDFYDINEFMINSGFYDHYIEDGFESLYEAYRIWEYKVVPKLISGSDFRFVLVRFSPSRDKFVIVCDSANI